MNKTLFAATAAIALMTALPAAAGEWYAQVNAGATVSSETDGNTTFTPDDTDYDPWMRTLGDADEGFAVGAAAGYAVGNGVRVEGEFLYTSNDLDGIPDLDTNSVELNNADFFVNVLYDIPMQGGFQPYIGAGVGFGSTTLDIDNESTHDEGTAWQIKVGANYPVNDTLTLDFGYRYVEMADWDNTFEDVDPSFDDDDDDAGPGDLAVDLSPTAHILTVGARFKLGNTAE